MGAVVLMRAYLAIALLACACTKTSTKYCGLHPEDERCGGDGGGTQCAADDDCAGTAATPVCEPAGGVCVQCTDANRAACSGTTPACGDDHRCTACTTHDDC